MTEDMNKHTLYTSWAYSFKTSEIWLTAVQVDKTGSKYTQLEYARALYRFCEWCKKTPNELIAERKIELRNPDTEMDAENRLRKYCAMLETEKVNKSTIVTKYHAPVKSFYSYNDVPLRLKTPRHVTLERQPHTVEEIKSLMKICDVRERTIIMFLKDSGISREDAVSLKYGVIQAEFEQGKDVIHIKLVRQKEAISYSTFIGKEAIEYLKAYLDYRKQKGEKITKDSPLLANLNGKPLTGSNLSMIFWRLTSKIGFVTSPHRFRKFFESHLGLAAPSLLVKFWMGHSLAVEGSYFMPPIENQREKYREGYKELEIFKTEISDLEIRKKLLIDQMVATKPNVDRKALENLLARVKTSSELDTTIGDIGRKGLENIMIYTKPKKDKDCNDGKNCQKIIEENELASHMEQGWKFISALPSGKIVISNE